VVPALIDLHVQPVLAEDGRPDLDLLAVQARAQGLDGIVVVGAGRLPELGATAALTAATGVLIFAGVGLQTAHGLVIGLPRQVDADWGDLGGGVDPSQLATDTAIAALAERGATILWTNGAPVPHGVHGVFSLVGGDEPALDPAAVQVAYSQRIACVAGSGAQPGEPRFGVVATMFASPPTNQEQLVEALRSGRCFPVEVGCPWMSASPGREPGRFPMVTDRGQRPPRQVAETEPRAAEAGPSDRAARMAERDAERAARATAKAEALAAQRAAKVEAKAQRDKLRPLPNKGGRYKDLLERPGDNRGNRLQREELARILMPPQSDDIQPYLDPVAAVYGLDSKKTLRMAGKSDYELDKINGNRAKGHDPNVMYMPTFDELRTDRQSITVLFAHTEEQYRLEDSVALRFALQHFRGEDGDLQMPDGHHGGHKYRGNAGPKPFRRRR